MTRNRALGLQAQQTAGWTDEQATLANTIATVTVDMESGDKAYYRRSPNWQWPMKGGALSFSKPGTGNTFSFTCGSDSLTGTADVLPLVVTVNDGANMQLNLTFTNQSTIDVDKAYFLQGAPVIGGNGGNGVTPIPTPGIYYSWPQLLVTGTIEVGGTTYTVESGNGWIDHEIMMSSLENANGVYAPVPFIDDSKPYNGWVWQYYNFENNAALTGAGFIVDNMTDTPALSYGYYLQPDGNGGWTAIFVNGNITLANPISYPSQCGDPTSAMVSIPTTRSYSGVENILLGNPLSGSVAPWYKDGTFNFPNGTVCSEEPGDYTDTSGNYSNGVGYMESVGFQAVADYQAYVLSVLQQNS
jgi:hypothetical protein